MMPENDIKKEKIREMLTPDVIVCGECLDNYKTDISCSICGIIVLKPSYEGKVYECPICGKLYCETCWGKSQKVGGDNNL